MCKQDFMATDGLTYEIDASDESEIIVRLNNTFMGNINLRHIEDDHSTRDIYYITHLALDACKRRGIGRECLRYHIETYDSILTASTDSLGIRASDGSHLTGDGVGFIEQMRKEGLVVPDYGAEDSYDYRDDYEDD